MKRRPGYTLLELMIVVVIIGILSSVAMVGYGNLMRKAKEGDNLGNLGAIRSALSIYYADLEMSYPSDLGSLTVGGKYLKDIPGALSPDYHPQSSAYLQGTAANDSAGWLYDNVSGDASFGAVYVNCTHTDSKGSAWTSY